MDTVEQTSPSGRLAADKATNHIDRVLRRTIPRAGRCFTGLQGPGKRRASSHGSKQFITKEAAAEWRAAMTEAPDRTETAAPRGGRRKRFRADPVVRTAGP